MGRINPHRQLKGVFVDHKNNLYTKSLGGRKPVYGERIVREGSNVYREWDPKRSKLGAGIKCKVSQIAIRPGSRVLYLGASTGTTVSHVADLVGEEGGVYALDFAPITTRMLFKVVDRWPNVAPLLFSAMEPGMYKHLVGEIDVVFQDIAQRAQLRTFVDNCNMYLPNGGFGLLSLKAKSIDVTAKPKVIFADVERELAKVATIVDKRILEPYEKDHCLFVVKFKGN